MDYRDSKHRVLSCACMLKDTKMTSSSPLFNGGAKTRDSDQMPSYKIACRSAGNVSASLSSAGFRTRHTGHVLRGLHKKGTPQK